MTITATTLRAPKPLTERQIDRVVGTLTSAFVSDPVIRWMYPGALHYLAAFPRFLNAFGGGAFAQGTVGFDQGHRAAALWLAPGSSPDDEAIEKCLLATVDETRQTDLFAVFADMEKAHPEYPHWYLPWFGTDALWQSQGIGSALMQEGLASVDIDGLPAYLETPNPRNIAFYERHGFVVTGLSQHGDCPPITFMQRDARLS